MQGDEPRFLDLYAKSVKSSRKQRIKRGHQVPDVTNIPIQSDYDEIRRRSKNSNMMNNQDMQDMIIDIEQQADRQEESSLPTIMSNIMSSFTNNLIPFRI